MLARTALALIWIYQGLVLLTPFGIVEVVFGLILLLAWRWRWLLLVNIGLALVTIGAAFNPVTLNVAVIALALIGFIASRDTPSASRCRRTPRKDS